MKEQQKQYLIDIMKAEEELGLYDETEHLLSTEANKKRLLYDKWRNGHEVLLEDIFNAEKKQGVKDLIDTHKQETLEEVAKQKYKGEYICNGIDIVPAWREGFVDGAKWQQERMYSEEDMLKSFMAGIKCESNKGENFEQFINQFKNK